MSSSLATDEQLIQALGKKDVIVLDVRGPGEFASGAFPAAVNIPINDLPCRISEVGNKDRTIITYCAVGGRSGRAAGLLKEHGFTHVFPTTNAEHLSEVAKRVPH